MATLELLTQATTRRSQINVVFKMTSVTTVSETQSTLDFNKSNQSVIIIYSVRLLLVVAWVIFDFCFKYLEPSFSDDAIYL